MSNEYPKMLYKCPGPIFGNHGVSYAYTTVGNEEEEKAEVEAGWSVSLADAHEASLEPKELEQDSEDTNNGAQKPAESREELELQAKELGITFKPNISDAGLKRRIEETLAK